MLHCCCACVGLTVILVALLRALTQSTRSCWSLACRKNFLIPALMTNRRQEDTDRYDLTHFSRSEKKPSGGLLMSYQQSSVCPCGLMTTLVPASNVILLIMTARNKSLQRPATNTIKTLWAHSGQQHKLTPASVVVAGCLGSQRSVSRGQIWLTAVGLRRGVHKDPKPTLNHGAIIAAFL